MKPFILVVFLLLGSVFQLSTYAAKEETKAHMHTNSHESHEDHDVEEDDHDHVNESHEHEENSEHDDEQEEGSTRIENAMATQSGIETSRVSSQVLHQTIVVYGNLTIGSEKLSHVRARYSGMIKTVKRSLGDRVKRGDLLAEVESNESLKVYQVRAPIAGTIIQRHANTGELTQSRALFSIANFDTLWAEFRIYPYQQSLVKVGQNIDFRVNDLDLSGSIQHIIPVLDKPYQLARIVFDNQSTGLTSGLLVEGRIVVDKFTAQLAVDKNAIQTMNGQPVVFVKQGDEYTFAPIALGRSDDRYVEVLSGLSLGQDYVVKNSYLIKADIEKSEAEHEH